MREDIFLRPVILAMKDTRALPAIEMKIKKPSSYIPYKGRLQDKIIGTLRQIKAVTL